MAKRGKRTKDESTLYDEVSVIEALCDQYVKLHRAGDAPTIKAFAKLHPKQEARILGLLPTVMVMEGARNRNIVKRKDGRVNRGPEKIPLLGDFEILRELGRGGMGIVYEAHQRSLDRRVAVKVLPKHALNQDQVDRFCREALTAASLHHTNIAPVYGVGDSNGFHYYAMQLLEGRSLDRFVRSHNQTENAQRGKRWIKDLSIADVVDIGRHVASALSYAHQQGVCHRDIKPSNLILGADSHVWITDFGLATQQRIEQEPTTGVSGTLRYMAPEKFLPRGRSTTNSDSPLPDPVLPRPPRSPWPADQVKGATSDPHFDEDLDHLRTHPSQLDQVGDIYSLGITLIELLTGKPAFASTTAKELTQDIQQGNLAPIIHFDKALPGDLESILRKSVSVDPLERYPTANALGHDLDLFLEGRPVLAKPRSFLVAGTRWIQRNRALAVVSALAATLLVATVIVPRLSYFRVQTALNTERNHRLRNQNTAYVASRAIDRMFNQFSSGSVFSDRPLETSHARPRLSQESVAMLVELSDFYVQLASQSGDDSPLAAKAIAARCRVGEINERLGAYQDAAESYRIAINGYRSLMRSGQMPNSADTILQLARLHNQLGIVNSLLEEPDQSEPAFRKAIDLLEPKTEQSPTKDERLFLELARSHYLLGSRPRPGMGPNSLPPPPITENQTQRGYESRLPPARLAAIKTSINLLNEINDDLPGDRGPRVAANKTHLLALCYRELALDEHSERDNSNYRDDAIGLLDELVEKYPEQAVFQFDLMRTLADINVFGDAWNKDLDTRKLFHAYRSLHRAIDIGNDLIRQQPDIPNYRVELLHTNYKLGRIAELKSRSASDPIKNNLLAEQEQCLRAAATAQSVLASEYPDAIAYQVWHARLLLSLAACPAMQSQIENRNREIGRSITVLNQLPQDVRAAPEVQSLIAEAEQMSRDSLLEPVRSPAEKP